jgi:hypothetical protein
MAVETRVVNLGYCDLVLIAARSIALVRHTTTSQMLLKKMIHRDRDPVVVGQIHAEIEILHACNNANVVKFFGAFVSDDGAEVHIVMEYMVRLHTLHGLSLSISLPRSTAVHSRAAIIFLGVEWWVFRHDASSDRARGRGPPWSHHV